MGTGGAEKTTSLRFTVTNPDDPCELNFWGATRLTFEMGGPNKCPICREERPVPADLGPPDDIKAYIQALKDQEGDS